MINIFRIIICCFIFFGAGLSADDVLSCEELNREGVRGLLGEKLGTIVTIEATVLLPAQIRTKASQGKTILNVYMVNGKKLAKSVNIELNYAYSGVKQCVSGEKVRYVGFESGRFTGLPNGYLKYIVIASTNFHFTTYFTALKKIMPLIQGR